LIKADLEGLEVREQREKTLSPTKGEFWVPDTERSRKGFSATPSRMRGNDVMKRGRDSYNSGGLTNVSSNRRIKAGGMRGS